MARPRRWTPERLEEFAKLIKAGKTLKEVAAYYNISPGHAQDIRLIYNLPKFRNSSYRWDPVTLGRLKMLRKQHGYTHKQLAEYFGVSTGAIFRVIDRYDVERRDYNKVSAKQLAKIHSLKEQGKSAKRIAIFLREKPDRIKNIIKYYSSQARKGKGPWADATEATSLQKTQGQQRTIQAP